MDSNASLIAAKAKFRGPPVKILACGPNPLLSHIQQRLARFQLAPPDFSDSLSSEKFQQLQAGDTLFLLQAPSFESARQLADIASQKSIHYIEISTCDSPFGAAYGFALAVAGQSNDLQVIKPWLDALAPQGDGWWHVGHAGAAAFMGQLQQLGALNPLNLGQIPAELGNLPPQLIQLCHVYLARSADEHFVPFHPNRQKALTHYLNKQDSPARQLAHLLSTFTLKP